MFDMGLTVTVEAKSKVGESSSTSNNLKLEILDKIYGEKLYTIMADGTSDKNSEEMQGIVIRFIDVVTHKLEERALNVGRPGRLTKEILNSTKKLFA